MKIRYTFLALCLALCFSTDIFAQLQTPSMSPATTLEQRVGLTDITISYSRPSRRGRKLFGAEGLIPHGELWRTGANTATKFTTSNDIRIAGEVLPKGEYALLSVPGETEWTFNFYAYTSGNWSSYTKVSPSLSTTSAYAKTSHTTEVLTLDILPNGLEAATFRMAWGNVKADLAIELPAREQTLKNIDALVAAPNWLEYYRAASYLHETGADLPRALEYIQLSNATPGVRFFQKHKEAAILRDLKRVPEAMVAAEKALELSRTAKDAHFTRLSAGLIEELRS
ncbi:MAG: DUF2911 domain-containing protein [Saprospiraceae bacterium]